ncbi:hypothetical protein GGX14DRAFT_466604 [Mycena pura]|uniref:F-box domain-containing protein n=1 Tax=Mycena pura TaxID=153505 RepID=A0AAD6V8X6_9AGAR|nr:hypothetical protein GGX14DRAFT_466604 [Mycena pura]
MPTSATSQPLRAVKSPIHALPLEVLGEIFKMLVANGAACRAVTQVCRRWRMGALGDSNLWREVTVSAKDAYHIPVVEHLLHLSKGRTIALTLNFHGFEQRERDRNALGALLSVVASHLGRCSDLRVKTDWDAWAMMTALFVEERYEHLVSLDLKLIHPPHTPTIERLPPFPFPLSQGHRLQRISLRGMSTQVHQIFTHLTDIRIVNDVPCLYFWLRHPAERLWLETFRVPASFPHIPRHPSSAKSTLPRRSPVTHLVLMGLRATRDGPHGDSELSCVPFFEGLRTPCVRVLEIVEWDPCSRVWGDFLAVLVGSHNKYPLVAHLRLCRMHLVGLSYADTTRFLQALPTLETMRLERCYQGTWEKVLEVLEMDETLCPGLQEIRLQGEAVLCRNDPLPFRNVGMPDMREIILDS